MSWILSIVHPCKPTKVMVRVPKVGYLNNPDGIEIDVYRALLQNWV